MAIVIDGQLLKVEENTFTTSRGPQTDLVATIQQDGQDEKYPLRVVVSYKVHDLFKALKTPCRVRVPLFSEVKPKGKNGPWIQWIGLGVEQLPS